MDVVSETTESAALMITCPPEVVACLKIHTSRGDVFLIFESQFRPNKSSGASFFINTSMDATAVYLAALFNAEKHSSERDTSRQFQWHADTTSHFIGHILVPVQSDVNDRKSAKQTLLESSMTILKLNAELAAMKSEISSLATELETSKNTMSNLVENMRTRAHEIIKAQESLPSTNQRRFVSFISCRSYQAHAASGRKLLLPRRLIYHRP
jgi:septal ring factor EnvC (AmiA/AmiB activator)